MNYKITFSTMSTSRIKQTSKWQVVAISTDAYDNGTIYHNAEIIASFKDLSKEYMTIVYKRKHNSMVSITRTNESVKATSKYNRRYDTLGTTHAVIITPAYDNKTIKKVQGRNSYRILAKDGDVLLVKPKGVYL